MHSKRKSSRSGSEPISKSLIQPIPIADWIHDPSSWNKYDFLQEASAYLWDAYGSSTEQDKHALAMLAETLETFVFCCRAIKEEGLVIVHHNGVLGKNHHIDIRDKAIGRAVSLMNELGLTPKSRLPFKPPGNPEFEEFLRGPFST